MPVGQVRNPNNNVKIYRMESKRFMVLETDSKVREENRSHLVTLSTVEVVGTDMKLDNAKLLEILETNVQNSIIFKNSEDTKKVSGIGLHSTR